MDESYLSWLRLVLGISADAAKAIAARYPAPALLGAATFDELTKIPGVSADLASRLLEKARREDSREVALGDEEPSLPVCRECGSFVGRDATDCVFCGARLDPGAERRPADTPVERLMFAREGDVRICVRCGAYLDPGATACPVCDAKYAPEELVDLPALDLRPLPESDRDTCARCGAYYVDSAMACVICGTRPMAAETTLAQNGKGVSRDFLTRWQKVAGEEIAPAISIGGLEEELESMDRLLEADTALERVWLRRGRILLSLGRPKDAIESFDRAGQLNPEMDAEYKRELIGALGEEADAALMPSRWVAKPTPPEVSRESPPEKPEERPSERPPFEQPTIPKQPRPTPSVSKAERAAIRAAIAYYDRLLAIDAGQRIAWEAKAELLRRLGRDIEAEQCFRAAKNLDPAERAVAGALPPGLHTRSPSVERPGRRASIAGRVNGRVNGLATGRVNGLTNGRVNGLTNGRVNGLTNGAGRVNGTLAGLTLGGRTNGLVNGDGFTNGRRGRVGVAPGQRQHWIRSVAGIASVVLLLVLAPILLSIFSSPTGVPAISIDGSFDDWGTVPTQFADRASDQTDNPDVNLLAYKVSAEFYALSVYARMEGLAFRGAGNGSDILVALIDADGRPDTGYHAGELGADYSVELYGWDARVEGAPMYRFDSTNREDWRGFVGYGAVAAASNGSELEFAIELDEPQSARILLVSADGFGAQDVSDAVVRVGSPALVVRETAIAPDLITTTADIDALRLDMWASGPPASVVAVNLTKRGSIADGAVTLRLFRDDGDGMRDAGDLDLGAAVVANGRASFPVAITIASPATLFITAYIGSLPPNETFGIGFQGLSTNATVTLAGRDPHLAYLGQVPGPTIDGAFGDWAGTVWSRDPVGDVANRTPRGFLVNANIDITEAASYVGSDVSVYLRVDGTMLGGIDVPNLRARFPGPTDADSDLDGVPDNVEFPLGTVLPQDFNNDNTTDAETLGDVDGDGVLDYPSGPDIWLNTTIPAWYPPPYAGRPVSRYVGPVATPVFEGVDSAIVYVEADGSIATGLPTSFGPTTLGLDWAIVVLGRHGQIVSSELYRYRPATAIPWERVVGVPSAVDAHRLEVAVPALLLNLSANYEVIYYTTDWTLSYDYHDSQAGRAPMLRAPTGDQVVINEIAPAAAAEWVELANPTASPVDLTGWGLAILGGRQLQTIYVFASGSLGAWGSGSEFLAMPLAPNSLANAGGTLVLLDPNGLEIDRTRFGRMSASRTWARFKDPSTGMPMDSNRDGRDFYRSNRPSPSGENDRHRPTLRVTKVADVTTAGPGDRIRYTITVENTDTGIARTVRVNETLPVGVTFQSASVSPTTRSGQTIRWVLTDVAPGSRTRIRVQVTVDPTVTDRSVLVNAVRVEYTDQRDRNLSAASAWANVTVARAVIVVEKVASTSNASPGDSIVYTIYYNNTGSDRASEVWITDLLPTDVTYVTASVPPTSINGQVLTWRFQNVAPGPHSLTVTARVNANPSSSNLVNWVFLNYTSDAGTPLESSNDSATVAVPEFTDFAIVATVPLLLISLRRRSRRQQGSYSG